MFCGGDQGGSGRAAGQSDSRAETSDGVAGFRERVDSRGRIVRRMFIGPDGRPCFDYSGVAGWEADYNDRGQQTRISYLSTDGKSLMLSKEGVAEIRNSYDSRGFPVRSLFFGVDRKPCYAANGIAGWEAEYDSNGFQTRNACLDKDGNFVRAVGSGNIPGMHFGEISPDGKRLLFADVAGNRIVGLDLESGEAATALAPFHDRPTNHVNKNALTDWRMHKGIIATEPLHEEGCGGSFEWYQQRVNMTCGEPFHNPTDIDYDSQGNMYISDGYANCAVHKFDKDGNYVKTWGGSGYEHFFDGQDTPGKFLVPHSLCVDAKDHVWVCDRCNEVDIFPFVNKNTVYSECPHCHTKAVKKS